ncbi:MAG: hypothetical protein AAF608_13335 [Pseudomonadota bacterium]
MQRVLALVGLIAIGFVAVIGAMIGIGIYVGLPQIEEAETYSTRFLEEYGEDWDIAVLQAHATEELLEAAPNLDEVTIFFQTQFGPLQSIEELSCPNFNFETRTQQGQVMLARCGGEATFAQRRAALDIIVRKQAGEWGVMRFYLNAIPERRESPEERAV